MHFLSNPAIFCRPGAKKARGFLLFSHLYMETHNSDHDALKHEKRLALAEAIKQQLAISLQRAIEEAREKIYGSIYPLLKQ